MINKKSVILVTKFLLPPSALHWLMADSLSDFTLVDSLFMYKVPKIALT